MSNFLFDTTALGLIGERLAVLAAFDVQAAAVLEALDRFEDAVRADERRRIEAEETR